jgi:hypothetical protein
MSPARAEFDHAHPRYAAVLRDHVREGLVDYAGLKVHPEPLAAYLDELAAVTEREFNSWVVAERLSFMINLYNAQVLQLVADHYPVSGIRRIGGWFGTPWNERPVVRLFGNRITFDILVDNYMRRHYAEPAIHLALVCATRGAPPLRDEPYVPDRLYDQFLDQGRAFLVRAPGNRIDLEGRRLYLSPVFQRYQEDFERKAGSVAAYVRIYVAPDLGEALRRERFSIRYTDYDWALNDQTPQRRR